MTGVRDPYKKPRKKQVQLKKINPNGEIEYSQFNVRLPVDSIEWLRTYAMRRGCSLNLAASYAIYILYAKENGELVWIENTLKKRDAAEGAVTINEDDGE